MKYVSFLLGTLSLCSFFAYAAVADEAVYLTESELALYEQNLTFSASQNQSKNSAYSAKSQPHSILSNAQRLRSLAQITQPSPAQKLWVNQQRSSPQKLFVYYSDHPNKALLHVDISQQAKSTQKQWAISARLNHINRAIQEEGAQWLIAQLAVDDKSVDGLVVQRWLTSASFSHLNELKHIVNARSNLSQFPNWFLASLASQVHNNALYTKLWQQKVDAHTYRALEALATQEREENVPALVAASKVPELRSQAWWHLLSKFGSHPLTESLLIEELEQGVFDWQVASNLTHVSSPSLKRRIQKVLLQQPSSKLMGYAKAQLNKNGGQ